MPGYLGFLFSGCSQKAGNQRFKLYPFDDLLFQGSVKKHFHRFRSRSIKIGLTVLMVLPFTAGCGGGNGDQQAARQPNPGAGHGQGKAIGQQASQPPIPIAVEEAFLGAISSYYSATATLEAEKEAQILARVTGVIQALNCEEGDQVEKGAQLLSIENDEYRLRLSQAVANTSNLRDRHDRLMGMWERNLVSEEEYDQAKNELKAAEAAEDLARLNLSYTRVTAPFSGRIVSRLVDVGQNVNIGTPLFVISDFDPLLARVHVPSKEFKKLKVNQPVDLLLDSNQQILPGRIKLISPVIDPSTGTIKITVEIPEYPPQTRPGDFAEVSIVTEKHTNTILVPKIAVFTDRGDQIIFVAADSTAERRVVEVGFQDNVNTEILNGLSEGERVVVKGQRSLKHGAPVKIIGDRPPNPELTGEESPKRDRPGHPPGKKPKKSGRAGS